MKAANDNRVVLFPPIKRKYSGLIVYGSSNAQTFWGALSILMFGIAFGIMIGGAING